ncbi:MAG: hypothetical protein PHW00_01050 [Clostridia bacterium]|nr:hypothetical protein [Clostridia bacterium]
MERRKGKGLSVFLGIVVVLIILFFIVVNIPVNQLFGLGEIDLGNGTTLNGLGLGEYKLKDAYRAYRDLTRDDDEILKAVVDKPVSSNTSATDTYYSASSGSTVDYSSLLTAPLTTSTPQSITITDSNVGAILDGIVESLLAETPLGENIDVDINQFIMVKDSDGNILVNLVVSVSAEDLITLLGESVQSAYNSLPGNKPEMIVLSIDFVMSLADGKLSTTSVQPVYTLNNSQTLTNLATDLIEANYTSGNPIASALDTLASKICIAVNNLGYINDIDNLGNISMTTHTQD